MTDANSVKFLIIYSSDPAENLRSISEQKNIF